MLLLVGTPGTGKRPVGSYLEHEHGFVHLDLEDDGTRERLLVSSPSALRAELARLAEGARGVVLTWAAGPPERLADLRRLRVAGVELVWFDSDRGAACRAQYPGAGRLPRFRFVDTFDGDGRFRPVAAVAAELLGPAPRRRPALSRERFTADLRLRAGAVGAALAGAAAVTAAVVAGVSGGGGPPRPVHTLAAQTAHQGALPLKGVLVDGQSLAGVRLGDSMAAVKRLWGGRYTRCQSCKPAMWFYLYPPPSDPVGAGVQFDRGRVVAVFTLGSPAGWHTQDGIRVGQILDNPSGKNEPRWLSCAGYSAKPTQVTKGAVTSILTQGAAVYGFALTRPSVSPCH